MGTHLKPSRNLTANGGIAIENAGRAQHGRSAVGVGFPLLLPSAQGGSNRECSRSGVLSPPAWLSFREPLKSPPMARCPSRTASVSRCAKPMGSRRHVQGSWRITSSRASRAGSPWRRTARCSCAIALRLQRVGFRLARMVCRRGAHHCPQVTGAKLCACAYATPAPVVTGGV